MSSFNHHSTKRIVLLLILVLIMPLIVQGYVEGVYPPSPIIGFWGGDDNSLNFEGYNKLDGVAGGGLTYDKNGKVGSAFYFDGVDDYVKVTPSPFSTPSYSAANDNLDRTEATYFGSAATGVSLELWMKTSMVVGGDLFLAYRALGSGEDFVYGIRLTNECKELRFYVNTINGVNSALLTASTLGLTNFCDSNWHHVAGTYDGNNISIYVDGIASVPVAQTGRLVSSDAPFYIGGWVPDNSGYNRRFKGLIDEVSLYGIGLSHKKVLTPGEVLSIYNLGILGKQPSRDSGSTSSFLYPNWHWWPGDIDGKNLVSDHLNGVLNNVVIGQGKVDNSFFFTRSNNYVEVPDHNDLTPYGSMSYPQATFAAWIYVNPSDISENFDSIINKWGQNTVDDDYLFGLKTDGKLAFAFHTIGGNSYGTTSYNEIYSDKSIPFGRWTHVAVVRSSSVLTFYIDGEAAGSYTTAMDFKAFNNGAATLRIGGQGRGGKDRYFRGAIDEIQIYQNALAEYELKSIYRAGRAGQIKEYFYNTKLPSVGPLSPTPGNEVAKSFSWQITPATGSTLKSAFVMMKECGTSKEKYFAQYLGEGKCTVFWDGRGGLSAGTVQADNVCLGPTILGLQSSFLQNGFYPVKNYCLTVRGTNEESNTRIAAYHLTKDGAGVQGCDDGWGFTNRWAGEGSTSSFRGTNLGTFSGTAQYAAGKIGQAFNFNGNSLIRVDELVDNTLDATGGIAVEHWFKTEPTQIPSNSAFMVYKKRPGTWEYVYGTYLGVSGGKCGLGFYLTTSTNTYSVGSSKDTSATGWCDGQWHHVIGVYSTEAGSPQINLYVDGVLKDSKPVQGTPLDSNDPLYIGAWSKSPNAYFKGLIDEVNIYNYFSPLATMDTAVRDRFLAQKFDTCTLTDKCIGDSECSSGVSCVDNQCVAPACNDDCTTSGAKQCSGSGYQTCGNYDTDSCLEWGAVTSCLIGQTCSEGVCSSTCLTGFDTTNMAGWWGGDDNSKEVFGRNNGQAVGTTVQFDTGKVGKAFRFDGNSYVQAPSSDNAGLTNQITLQAWVKIPSTGNTDYVGIVSKQESGAYSYKLDITSEGGLWFDVWLVKKGYDDSLQMDCSICKNIKDNQWHLVTGTYDGDKARIYIDGVFKMEKAWRSGGVDINSFNGNILIGKDGCCNGEERIINGLIDEVQIFKQALTEEQIKSVYNAGDKGVCKPVVVDSDGDGVVDGDEASGCVHAAGLYPLGSIFFTSGAFNGCRKGDMNNDGYVTVADYSPWLTHYGMGEVSSRGDMNLDSFVTVADYSPWLTEYYCGNHWLDLGENCVSCPADVTCSTGTTCNTAQKQCVSG